NYILTHIVKNMPKGSKVVIDDVWFSDQLIKSNNVIDYFYQSMVHEIDPLLYFKGSYANYWEKGSFFGFREIIPFLNWVNHNHIQLKFEKGVKHIHFELNNPADYDYECLNDIQLNNYGSNDYNPVDLLLDENSMDPSLVKLYQSAKTSYAQANIDQALKQFLELSSSMQNQNHLLYAIAVCYSRLGQYDRALAAINKELDLNEPFILADSLKVKLTERI
ncbi:MAG: hypothetical protein KDD94_15000, partial [Calditrichaeota bacterium]|nr:hypothetical protein [Calditrichota bacterium]